jgi:hypothetical protein
MALNHFDMITELERNCAVFKALLQTDHKQQKWKIKDDKWSLLEVICHLLDEEREDFRARLRHVFETPDQPFKPIDPEGWVITRKYIEQDYEEVLIKFLEERKNSVRWLKSLNRPPWLNKSHHQQIGELTAELLLANWVAHDYFHFRQITRIKYDYLQQTSAVSLKYAGEW